MVNKDVKSKVAAKKWLRYGRLMVKILITTIFTLGKVYRLGLSEIESEGIFDSFVTVCHFKIRIQCSCHSQL